MSTTYTEVIEQIAALPADWHGAGSVNRDVLSALARHAASTGRLQSSAETGCGRTTLLFSHLSDNHTVFATEGGGSLAKTKASPLLRPGSVTFVEGPSQRTLPRHDFSRRLQAVLIDGPHGYPFPDLEYYYFYPHLDPGGLLVIDDTSIPTIARMLEILRSDDMFDLVEVVADTAFLRRTHAPMIDPYGDSWWLQGYNRAHYERITAYRRIAARPSATTAGRLLRGLSNLVPQRVKDLVPSRWKDALRRGM